jgi:hypothetical protein
MAILMSVEVDFNKIKTIKHREVYYIMLKVSIAILLVTNQNKCTQSNKMAKYVKQKLVNLKEANP